MKRYIYDLLVFPAFILAFNLQTAIGFAQGTAFTYQGRLESGGAPANGSYDMAFTLYDSTNVPGNVVAGPVTNSAVSVSNGRFTVTLDFRNQFNGDPRWLEIGVRTNGGGTFAPLAPRQELFPTPYAIFAGAASNVLGAVSASQLSAGTADISINGNAATATSANTAASATTANNFTGSLSGDVTGTQSATIVSSVGGQSAANIATGASVANAATSTDTAGTIVKRDASGNLAANAITVNNLTNVNTFADTLNVDNIYLPATAANAGVIYAAGSPLIYSGESSVFIGYLSGNFSSSVTNLAASWNAALGDHSLASVTTGYSDTAVGSEALQYDTNGYRNTALGRWAMIYNTTGYQNTGTGFQALRDNASGHDNTADGAWALARNTTGTWNTAVGVNSLVKNTTGSFNTADGNSALNDNFSGSFNTASGFQALWSNTTGTNNIALGNQAGYNVTGNNNIDIGNLGLATDNGIIRIGTPGTHTNAFIAGTIFGDGGGLTNLNASQFSGGTLPLAQLPASVVMNDGNGVSLSGTFGGDGSGLTNLNAAALNGLAATRFWQLGGNNVTTGQFFGSTNDQPLELWVNNMRAFRLEPDATGSEAPNIIGGSPLNFVANGVVGATIAGGGEFYSYGSEHNSVTGDFGFVGGGIGNQAASLATVGGGEGNGASGGLATVAGGLNNAVGGSYATVGGGNHNSAGGNAATVAGGYNNTAGGYDATVAGGVGNGANGNGATVGGGGYDGSTLSANTASGNASVVCGGLGNTAGGNFAVVSGGEHNIANGAGSFSAGENAQATNDNSFVWSDGSTNTTSTTTNEFIARASGGFVLYSSASGTGVSLAPGSGSWSTLSDRNAKDDFAAVNSEKVLARVAALPMATWSYKTERGVRHIGPMAQDFYAAFKVGEDNKHITEVDEGGVALAAIQGLDEKVKSGKRKAEGQIKQLKTENAKLQAKVADLQSQLESLQKAVARLADKSAGGFAFNAPRQEER